MSRPQPDPTTRSRSPSPTRKSKAEHEEQAPTARISIKVAAYNAETLRDQPVSQQLAGHTDLAKSVQAARETAGLDITNKTTVLSRSLRSFGFGMAGVTETRLPQVRRKNKHYHVIAAGSDRVRTRHAYY